MGFTRFCENEGRLRYYDWEHTIQACQWTLRIRKPTLILLRRGSAEFDSYTDELVDF